MKQLHGARIAPNFDTVLVIRIPNAQIFRILYRTLFLAMVLVMLPFLGSFLKRFSASSHPVVSRFETAPGLINVQLLNQLLHDLANEGLLRNDDKALVVNPPPGFGGVTPLRINEMDTVMDLDLQTQSTFTDESYDFVFTSSSEDFKLVDRILKIDGIVALPLGTNPSIAFKYQSNCRVVYLRRYSSIIVALKKTSSANKLAEFSAKRRLFQLESESKKVALEGLEDVLLEPPGKALVKSKKYLKKIKYLPNLLGDSLESYKRRVFIGAGFPEENRAVIEWFQKNYPKKNKKFEIHNLQAKPHTDVSAWLLKHVKEEEYVVMKAEAEVVEGMIKKGAISLVDELFLECKNEWWHAGKRKKDGRPYWECLALYGRLRDEGVAVHQWWG